MSAGHTYLGRTYLDWNASAPLLSSARVAMLETLDLVGNASSVHAEGRRARSVIETARDQVAKLVGAASADVVFTSGATEANASVLAGGWDTILVGATEHDSVLASARRSAARVVVLPVTASGVLDVEQLNAAVRNAGQTFGRALLSVQMANSETGMIQPLADIAALAKSHGILVHSDAVQAAGRIAIDVAALGIDYLTLSAHKIGGPKGAGALILRDGAALPVLIAGGGQERRRRAGTENIAAIAGFGAAALEAHAGLATVDAVRARRDRLETEMSARFDGMVVVGANAPRLANTSCVARRGSAAETLVIKYDLAGVAVSAGSACSSGKVGTSHVLAAMGLAPDLARSAIRISIGRSTTDDDIAAFLAASEKILRSAALAA